MMNRTMKLLLLSDIFVLTGFGLIQPILAIYINDGGVTGGTMVTAGMASALFMLTKSLVQLPFGHYGGQPCREREVAGPGNAAHGQRPHNLPLGKQHLSGISGRGDLWTGQRPGLPYLAWPVVRKSGPWQRKLPVVHLPYFHGHGDSGHGRSRCSSSQPGGLFHHIHVGRAALHCGLSGTPGPGAQGR